MDISDLLWDKAKEQILKRALLEIGLSATGLPGRIVYGIGAKLLDKYVRPQYEISVAHAEKEYVRYIEKTKLKELDDAIKKADREAVIRRLADLR